MRTLASPPARCLPLEAWPPKDQAAWAAATRGGDVLEDSGLFAGLRSSTLHARRTGCGRWLAFLAAGHRLDPEADPATRISKDNVAAYIAAA